jgi:hypothetical protein
MRERAEIADWRGLMKEWDAFNGHLHYFREAVYTRVGQCMGKERA